VSFEYCKKELKGEICKYLGPNQEYDELNLMEKLKYQKAISIIIGTAASLSTPVTVYLLYKLLQSLLNIEPENWVLKIVAVNTGIMFIAGINNYMSQQYYKVKAMNTVKSTLSTENQSVNIKETKKLIITLDKILFEIEK
jgi:ABC-type multidrug transport system fused ATPase/permease subunit